MYITELNATTRVMDLGQFNQLPWVELHRITPEVAQSILDTRNTQNRVMREWWAKVLAHSMTSGNWHVTTNSIGFDSKGLLINGQHTLRACVIAGVPIQTFIAFNLHPKAFEVIDIGMKRRVQDLLRMEKRYAEVVRFASILTFSRTTPMADDMRVLSDAGLMQMLEEVDNHCARQVKFYSSVPMRLAACMSIVLTSNREYVLQQYEALCSMNFDQMSKVSQLLVRQVASGKARSFNTGETLARGMIVFDYKNRNHQKIYAEGPDNIAWARERARGVLLSMVEASGLRGPAKEKAVTA
jgi:hypothetical protein